jgi:hypothetical protein
MELRKASSEARARRMDTGFFNIGQVVESAYTAVFKTAVPPGNCGFDPRLGHHDQKGGAMKPPPITTR